MTEDQDTQAKIKAVVDASPIVLFMKGTRLFPRCGFSATVVEVLKRAGAEYQDVDVLKDPEIRQGIKDFANWPTIPQLYIAGEFVGGCDIVRDMFLEGELQPKIDKALGRPAEQAES